MYIQHIWQYDFSLQAILNVVSHLGSKNCIYITVLTTDSSMYGRSFLLKSASVRTLHDRKFDVELSDALPSTSTLSRTPCSQISSSTKMSCKYLNNMNVKILVLPLKSQTTNVGQQFTVRSSPYVHNSGVRLRGLFTYESWDTRRKTRWRLQGG